VVVQRDEEYMNPLPNIQDIRNDTIDLSYDINSSNHVFNMSNNIPFSDELLNEVINMVKVGSSRDTIFGYLSSKDELKNNINKYHLHFADKCNSKLLHDTSLKINIESKLSLVNHEQNDILKYFIGLKDKEIGQAKKFNSLIHDYLEYRDAIKPTDESISQETIKNFIEVYIKTRGISSTFETPIDKEKKKKFYDSFKNLLKKVLNKWIMTLILLFFAFVFRMIDLYIYPEFTNILTEAFRKCFLFFLKTFPFIEDMV
jgi:hypothetical protein